MRLRHPSRERLAEWLNGEPADTEDLDAHIDTCQRCSTVIEALAGQTEVPSLSVALSRVLSAPADLPQRLEERVAAKLSSREVVGLMAELFGAGLETGRLLIVESPRGEEL